MDKFNKLLEKQKEFERRNSYSERIAGDVSEFRYPHLNEVSGNFEYDDDKKTFFLKKAVEETITKISINEITLYELLNQTAKRLHLFDFFGYQATEEEKYKAFQSVCEDYKRNQETGNWNLKFDIQKVDISKIEIRDEFEYLKTFIRNSANCIVYFCKFKDVQTMFQIGGMLKGTNIVFIDSNRASFCQELFHAIYHLEEGIPGVNGDNLNIVEVWGNVDALYLKQLIEGRLSRRIRKNSSPHDIKFLDYVFLRAYIGQAFLKTDETAIFHSAYSLIEPTMKLLFDSMQTDIKSKNQIVIDGICYDKTETIKSRFNAKYGEGAYEKVFYDFNLFHRISTIKEICKTQKISYEDTLNIMFSSEKLIPTVIGNDVVRFIWLNPIVNQNKKLIIDLIEDYSENARKAGIKINLQTWLEHVKTTFGMEQYKFLKDLI